jgi:hypothetical protein
MRGAVLQPQHRSYLPQQCTNQNLDEIRYISWLERWAEPHVGAVELTKFGLAEEHPVDFVVHLFQADLFISENFADENPPLVPANVAAVVHSPRLKRFWILKARYSAWQQSSAGHVDASRRLVGKRLMRALMVEDKSKAIELLLLRRYRACRRLGRVLLQRAVHPFVSPVLLRVSWLNAFVNNAELHPTQRQLRQTQQAHARKRCSVVGANAFWHAVLAHRGIADSAYLGEVHPRDCLAADQKPAVCIGDREWIATISSF